MCVGGGCGCGCRFGYLVVCVAKDKRYIIMNMTILVLAFQGDNRSFPSSPFKTCRGNAPTIPTQIFLGSTGILYSVH